MHLKKIFGQNFKSFKELNFDLKKINILLGPNNSGKSNIIKLLLLLKQTYTSNLQSPLILNGNIISFGSYKHISYRFLKEPIQISLIISDPYEVFSQFRHVYEVEEIPEDTLINIEAEYQFDSETKRIKTSFFRINNLNSKISYFEYNLKKNEVKIRNQKLENFINNFKSLLETIINLLENFPELKFKTSKVLYKGVSTIAKKLGIKLDFPNLKPITYFFKNYFEDLNQKEDLFNIDIDSKFPKVIFNFSSIERDFREFGEFAKYFYYQSRRKHLKKYILNGDINSVETYFGELYGSFRKLIDFENYIDNIFSTIEILRNNLTYFFNQLYYIGPLRKFPERYFSVMGETASDVGFKGEFAPYLIKESIEKESLKKIFNNINFWLNKFEMAKTTKIRRYEEIQEYLSIECEEFFSGLNVNLIDMGVGTSQVLPIIIEGFFIQKNSLLLIEQPEIHLHPKAQTILGDLFVDLANSNKIMIIETHSEHLIQRIQRRIAEGIISHEDVVFYYVTMDKDGSTIQKLDLDEDGFIIDLPDGFFDEDYKESYEHLTTVFKKKEERS